MINKNTKNTQTELDTSTQANKPDISDGDIYPESTNDGFNAYGLSPNNADPVVTSIAKLLAHIQAQDKHIDALQNAICRLDPDFYQIQH